MNKIKVSELNDSEIDIMYMIYYLIVAENPYLFVVDHICCIIVTAGAKHPFDPKNVSSCMGISKESLGKKRNFLKSVGLTQLADNFDNKIRNAAAHQSFEIRADGLYIHELGKVINPDLEYAKLRNVSVVGYEAIRHYYDLYHGPLSCFPDSVFTTQDGIERIVRAVEVMRNTNPDQWKSMADKVISELNNKTS
ncbi:MAG: hypothetical protein OXC46_01420 [Thaumarchaeota archaeon]|nr:hypothetical protein [Nitrososphaerota archaeon]